MEVINDSLCIREGSMGKLVEVLNSFRGKRVLLTGDTGFKGSWLALWLADAGADVYGYALPAECSNDHFNLLCLRDRINHVDGDLRDLEKLKEVFFQAEPEFVFHLAAQALVRRSYRDPKETFDVNIGGSVNVLECVRASSTVTSLVYVTSDKCYHNKEWLWGYRENDELGGHDPYSASKAAAELVFSAYRSSFFEQRKKIGVASVRAGNVIGGGDWSEDRIVPDCINALQRGDSIVLRRPQATRPWQHVLEPLGGYLTLAVAQASEPGTYSGAWNFGPENRAMRSVEDLARTLVSHWGEGEIEIRISENDPHEAGLLRLNCDKATHQLGWRPRWDYERTVAETVDWYRSVAEGKSAAVMSSEQIRRYMEMD